MTARPEVGTPVMVTHLDRLGTIVPTGRDVADDEVNVMLHDDRAGSIVTWPVTALRPLRIVDDALVDTSPPSG